eukprot:GFUD01005115.1.p1 GENE.GFUD01005115.1~~GFUD01005115.1.p1  ORF type:complete len:285 (+),score=64.84 GFUD01005115.1:39-893(+)
MSGAQSKVSPLLRFLPTKIRNQLTKPVVSVLRLQGTISSQKSKKFINLENTRKQIDKAFSPKRLASVLLTVNSPGGSPVQSDLVTSYIQKKASKQQVPVVVFVEDMAASGGYWLACAGSEIFASRSSVIGSLGVIYFNLGIQELIQKLGVERRVITAGDNKALMDPLSPLKEGDVKIIKTMLENTHKHFVDHVKKNRGNKLTGSDDALFNGGIWTAEPALELGLIDGIANMDDYIETKFGDNVKVIRLKPPTSSIAEAFGASLPTNIEHDLIKSQLENFGKLRI